MIIVLDLAAVAGVGKACTIVTDLGRLLQGSGHRGGGGWVVGCG